MAQALVFPPLTADADTVRLRFGRRRTNVTVVGPATGTRYYVSHGQEFDCHKADAVGFLAESRGGSRDFVRVTAKPRSEPVKASEPKAEPKTEVEKTPAKSEDKATGTAAKKAAEKESAK